MKSLIKPIFSAAILLMSGSAFADSLQISSQLSVTSSSVFLAPLNIGGATGFTPKDSTWSVRIAGKTCTFGSSAQGSVPGGCNYTIVITENGLEPVTREASPVCLQHQPVCQ